VPCVGGVCQGNCDPDWETCPDGTCCHVGRNACQHCEGPTCVHECQSGQRCDDEGRCVCDGQNCPNGCCQGGLFGECVAPGNQSEDTCGAGGETCVACQGFGVGCCGGVCCNAPDLGRNPQCCWESDSPATDGTCTDVRSDPNNCGACFHKCTADQHCVGGQCVCDGQTCPHGCCDAQGRCQPGTSDQVCGRGGGACATCGSGNRCVAGQCVCDTQTCIFGQCCENGPGNPGRCFTMDDEHCGSGGEKCQICEGLDECGYCGDPPSYQCC
jgi:hypothetical protein